MKNIGIVLVFIICSVSFYKAFYIWQQAEILEYKNIQLRKEMKDLQDELERLQPLEEIELGFLENNYRNLDEQIRLFIRTHDLRMSLVVDKLKPNELISNAAHASPWLGVKQIVLHIHFYDLKETGQYIRILKCLDRLEASSSMRIFSLVQNMNQLEVGVQLYGR